MENEKVSHPKYYQGKVEVIDLIADLDFCRGNAIKYIYRSGKKNPDTLIEDLEKAKFYIDYLIKNAKDNVEPNCMFISETEWNGNGELVNQDIYVVKQRGQKKK